MMLIETVIIIIRHRNYDIYYNTDRQIHVSSYTSYILSLRSHVPHLEYKVLWFTMMSWHVYFILPFQRIPPGHVEAVLRYDDGPSQDPTSERIPCTPDVPCDILNCPYR